MNRRLLRTLAAAATLSAAACHDATGPATQAAPRPPVSVARFGWVVTGVETIDLGTLGGGTHSIAYDINDAGVIVGESNYYPGGPVVPVRWTAPGVVSWLGSLGGTAGSARGINAGGGITGDSRLATGNYHAFFWTPALGMWDLGAAPSDPTSDSYGRAISDAGMVVGNVDLAAKYWTGGTGWNTIFTPFRPAVANDVNGLHHIVGENLSFELAYVRRGTTITYLPSIAGTPYHNTALGINDAGVVVGRANAVPTGYPRRHAFWWTEASGIHDLGTLPGGLESAAEDINEAGVIVGWSDAVHLDSLPTRRAFVWRSLMGMVSLPSLGGATRRGEAYAINASNWVVGWSHTATGQTHATLWKVSMRYEVPIVDYPIVYGGLTP